MWEEGIYVENQSKSILQCSNDNHFYDNEPFQSQWKCGMHENTHWNINENECAEMRITIVKICPKLPTNMYNFPQEHFNILKQIYDIVMTLLRSI